MLAPQFVRLAVHRHAFSVDLALWNDFSHADAVIRGFQAKCIGDTLDPPWLKSSTPGTSQAAWPMPLRQAALTQAASPSQHSQGPAEQAGGPWSRVASLPPAHCSCFCSLLRQRLQLYTSLPPPVRPRPQKALTAGPSNDTQRRAASAGFAKKTEMDQQGKEKAQ